jgi:hypothetical protein
MFCQKCGAEALDRTKFCKQCGHRLKTGISNKALLIAAIAAIVSIVTSLPLLFSSAEPIKVESSPTPLVVSASPSPTSKPSPPPSVKLIQVVKRTQTPEPTSERKPERPVVTWEPRPTPLPQVTLLAPRDGSVFFHVPRRLTLAWSPVQGATLYGIVIEYRDSEGWKPIHGTYTYMLNLSFTFSSPVLARWRVTPIFNQGHTGNPSEWQTFRFTQ